MQAEGFKLYLVDNKGEADLASIAQSIGGDVKTAQFDFENVDDYKAYEDFCANITADCSGEISMLINGVEKKDPLGERFQDSTDEDLIKLINVNSFPITFMSRFLGPDLKTKKGAIINLTSTYSQYGSQYLPIYSAIKSF